MICSEKFSIEEREKGFNILQNALINSTNPIFIGRLSGYECIPIGKILNNKPVLKDDIYRLNNNAGILCTNMDSLKTYVKSYTDALKNNHLLGIWDGGLGKQGYEVAKFIYDLKPSISYIPSCVLELFYFFEKSKYNSGKIFYKLNEYYKNKTILIITSHINSCKKQVENNNYMKIFAPYNIFDNCTFKFVKPPITMGGNNNIDWTIHFDKFKSDVNIIGEFDIALVSCGGYGMPICNYIYKDLNKSCMYVGGPLQLFFWHNWK